MSRLFLISNMYPSEKSPSFGIFVKNFEDSYNREGGKILFKAVIKNIYRISIIKLFVYIYHYLKILYLGLFKDYDVIYVHYAAHNAFPIVLLRLFRKKKVIVNLHGDDILPRTIFVKFLQIFVNILLRNCELAVVPSQFFKDIILDRGVVADPKIYISPSAGVNLDIFNPKVAASISKKPREVILGYVSRIDRGKGWDLFLELIYNLNAKNEFCITGLIVGTGNEVDLLKNSINRLQLNDRILFMNSIGHNNLASVYRSMDLFIFPTLLEESLGLVGIEAMACGVPVIGSNIGGLTSYIMDGVNGFLFTPNNSNELLLKTTDYLNLDENDKDQMILGCLRTADAFDSKTVSKSLFNKIQNV